MDNIDSPIIKLGRNYLVPSITHIINLSLQTSVFPVDWKMTKIVPLHKKKLETDPGNYRPLSLLSSLSKILEKAVFLQTIEYFEVNSLIDKSHHGFRSGHSTTTALIEMQDHWLEAFESGKLTAVLTLNMSAAFNLVRHETLLNKMMANSASNKARQWFKSYLS